MSSPRRAQRSAAVPGWSIESLPTAVQHAVIAAVPLLLAWLAQYVIPGLPQPWPLGLGFVVTVLTAIIAPVTRAYGTGSITQPPSQPPTVLTQHGKMPAEDPPAL